MGGIFNKIVGIIDRCQVCIDIGGTTENLGLGVCGGKLYQCPAAQGGIPRVCGGGVGEAVVMVLGVEIHGLPDGAQVRHAGSAMGMFAGPPKRGKQDRNQQRNDADDDEQFDKRKARHKWARGIFRNGELHP